MNDQLAGSLSVLISAIATAILMAAAYYWGPGKQADRHEKKTRRHYDEQPEEE
jgi:hypothetical protein